MKLPVQCSSSLFVKDSAAAATVQPPVQETAAVLCRMQEYKFQVQVPGKEDNKLLTVGRAELDMSHYVLAEGTPQSKMIPMMFKVGMASTGYLKVTITAEVVASGGDSDDGMTEVSGLTGMTANLGEDQDLSGESAPHAWGTAHFCCITASQYCEFGISHPVHTEQVCLACHVQAWPSKTGLSAQQRLACLTTRQAAPAWLTCMHWLSCRV